MIPGIVWTIVWALIYFGIGFVLGFLTKYILKLTIVMFGCLLVLLLIVFIATVTLFYPQLPLYFNFVKTTFSNIFSTTLWSLEQTPPTFLTDIKTQPVNTISSTAGFVIGVILSIKMA